MRAAIVDVGEVVADKYRIEGELGRGGMGVVFKAVIIDSNELVALKFMTPEGGLKTDLVARFVREGKAAMRLEGEHVAKVLDTGALDDGTPFIAMEFLRGEDLFDYVERRGALPVEQAARLVLQACVAMAEAHFAGVIHRDLKPHNLFVVGSGDDASIKVLDFGLSKLLDDDGAFMTGTNDALGSPLFMSPEQMRSSRDVDVRTDIWALGAVLYYAVTGDTPFRRGKLPDVIMRVMSKPYTPIPAELNVPAELAALIDRCLTKLVDPRPAHVGEVADVLAPFAGPSGPALLADVHAHMPEASAVAAKTTSSAHAAKPPPVAEHQPAAPADESATQSLRPPPVVEPVTPPVPTQLADSTTLVTTNAPRRGAGVIILLVGIAVAAALLVALLR